ncbi:ROK family protein [Actinomyces faecalis]|uniref:ROK family protein n=1 Tax=Actinomyces faecalis TaxID=2722820 RepID=UPI001553CD35|nr:ROK family protein [Actinomyces faecalis]
MTAHETPPPATTRGISFVHVTQLAEIIRETRRYPSGLTRADLAETLTMGRNAVDRRLQTLTEIGVLVPAGRGVSTGGRAPQMWRFNPDVATVLVLAVSYRRSTAALMTLGGTVVERATWDEGLLDGPHTVLASAQHHLEELRHCRPDLPGPWTVGVSLPIPVDFRDGSIVPPVTGAADGDSDWTGFPIRSRLTQALGLSVWVDDEVNTLALAASMRIGAPKDLLYIRLSLGLGMGIVSSEQVHRGVGAASGEIAHIQISGAGGSRCRCGRRGCLETHVSGGAMEATASTAQALRSSPYLREVMSERNVIHDRDVFRGVAQGDRVCRRIVTEAADKLATVLAVLATTYNPGEVILGGDIAIAGDYVRTVVTQSMSQRVLPVTAARLRIRMGGTDDSLVGACALATERILNPHVLYSWLPHATPVGVEALLKHRRQDG